MTSTNRQLSTRFADLDSWRMRRQLEDEHMGDWRLSQFYRDLRNQATPTTSSDFIFTLWMNRLPVHIQRVLATKEEKKAETLTPIADRPETGQIAAACADSTATEERQNRAMVPINDSLCRLEAQINALSLDTRRRLRSSSRRRRLQSSSRCRRLRSSSRGRRSRSRRKRQNSGFCYYHKIFLGHARKCRAPCNWTQRNRTSHP